MIINLHKVVCRNPFKSRVPGSVKPVNGYEECKYASEYVTGNYGMFPSDIEIPSGIVSSITDYTDTEVNVPLSVEDPTKFYRIIPSFSGNLGSAISDELLLVPINETEDKWSFFDGKGVERKFLTHTTLMKWYDFFIEYHNGLTIEGVGKFDSYEEYGEYLSGRNIYFNAEEFANKDELYTSRGGDIMCNFVTGKCIPMKTVEINGVSKTMYLSKIIDTLLWLHERYPLYSGITEDDCYTYAEDCCECKEYFQNGGNEFYETYSGLMHTHFSCGSETNTASFTLPIMLTNHDEIVGLQRELATDWDEDSIVTYNQIAKYDGYTYLNTEEGTSGYTVDEAHMTDIFGNLDPNSWDEDTESYSELPEESRPMEKMCEMDEILDIFNPGVFTAHIHSMATSQLHTVEDTISSVDNMGNKISGISTGMYYNGYDGIIREGSYFDLPYHIGNAMLREKLSSSVNENVYEDVYYGNFLSKMKFCVKYESGNTEYLYVSVPQGGKNEYYNQAAIQDCLNFIEENTDNPGILIDHNIYCSIQYQVGCHITRRQTYNESSNLYLQETFIAEGDFSGMTYVEECIIHKNSTQYCCGGFDDAVMVIYYSLEKMSPNGTADAYTPNSYGDDLSQLQENKYDYSPTFRIENDFGKSYSYKKRQNLNIDRGYAVAFESILKLTEAHTLEALEDNGNGFFNFV